MNHESVELHLAYGTDTRGRVVECCGNCGDLLGSTVNIVDARMYSGRRVEVHICEVCLEALQEFADELDIPLNVIDDTPDGAPPREPVG